MEKMLVTQGLNELKTLDARIRRAIASAYFVQAAKLSDAKVTPTQTKEEFEKAAISSYDSVRALIERREVIKSAIVQSNAETMVTVCGKEYSVAKVIDLKKSMDYYRDLRNVMNDQLTISSSKMNFQNSQMEEKIDALVKTAFGKESKTTIKPDEYDSIANPYRASNQYGLVDPLCIKEKVEELDKFIEEFDATVDAQLQISNCVTFIEI
jgi:hypothetical protein